MVEIRSLPLSNAKAVRIASTLVGRGTPGAIANASGGTVLCEAPDAVGALDARTRVGGGGEISGDAAAAAQAAGGHPSSAPRPFASSAPFELLPPAVDGKDADDPQHEENLELEKFVLAAAGAAAAEAEVESAAEAEAEAEAEVAARAATEDTRAEEDSGAAAAGARAGVSTDGADASLGGEAGLAGADAWRGAAAGLAACGDARSTSRSATAPRISSILNRLPSMAKASGPDTKVLRANCAAAGAAKVTIALPGGRLRSRQETEVTSPKRPKKMDSFATSRTDACSERQNIECADDGLPDTTARARAESRACRGLSLGLSRASSTRMIRGFSSPKGARSRRWASQGRHERRRAAMNAVTRRDAIRPPVHVPSDVHRLHRSTRVGGLLEGDVAKSAR